MIVFHVLLYKAMLYDKMTEADPGFVKRGSRESKCRDAARPEKVAKPGGGGGLRTVFLILLLRHLHYGAANSDEINN